MPKVSIIVPVYNVEKYIHRCIESILNQTFADFELILVDDGSPDRCGEICDEYAQKDWRIQVIHKANGGLASARNVGIEKSKGEYILFCDSDDYVSAEWCENFITNVKETKDNFIFCGINVVRVLENKIQTEHDYSLGDEKEYPITSFFALQGRALVGFAWNVLYYAQIIKENNIRFPMDVIVEDLPFVLNYLKTMNSLTYTGTLDYYYIQDERQTLSRKYYSDGFRRWKEKYFITQHFIQENICEVNRVKVKHDVADSYLYPFLNSLENTFDKRNEWSCLQKLEYNKKVVCSKEFQECLYYADTSNENSKYIWLLKHRKYYCSYLLKKLAQIKNRKKER